MRKRPVIAAGALLSLLALAGCGTSAAAPSPPAAAGTGPSSQPGITSHGIGRVAGSPDVVTITVGVQTSAGHANDALAANSSKANAVISALKGHGVAVADIQTSQLSLYPLYDNGNGNSIRGYNVTDTVVAKVRNVSQAGGAIDAAVAAGGDAGRVEGVSFSFNDDSSLLAHARADAVAAARAQAQQLADAAGAKLGSLRSLSEDVSGPSRQPFAASGAPVASATPVQAGTEELVVQVTAVWNLG